MAHQGRLFPAESSINLILSMHVEPYDEVRSMKKIYEYRTVYRKEPTTAFIYVTKVKSIKARIEFDSPIIGTDVEISSLADECKPGSYNAMMQYLRKGKGYAIPIKKLIEIEPVSLGELNERFPKFVVPQSYYLLEGKEELLQFLLSRKPIRETSFPSLSREKGLSKFSRT